MCQIVLWDLMTQWWTKQTQPYEAYRHQELKKKKKVVNIEYNVQSRQTPQESHSSVWQLWLCVLFAYSEDPSEMIL